MKLTMVGETDINVSTTLHDKHGSTAIRRKCGLVVVVHVIKLSIKERAMVLYARKEKENMPLR